MKKQSVKLIKQHIRYKYRMYALYEIFRCDISLQLSFSVHL